MNATWWLGRAEIEIGGFELVVDYRYQQLPDIINIFEPIEFEGQKACLKLAWVETPGAQPVIKTVDIIDILSEMAGGAESAWDLIRNKLEDLFVGFPTAHHSERQREV